MFQLFDYFYSACFFTVQYFRCALCHQINSMIEKVDYSEWE